MRRKNWRI